MSEKGGVEKAGLNNELKEIMNGILEGEEGTEKLRVEEVDTGIFVSPFASRELIKSPAYKEDVRENTGLLIDMEVREVMKGLLNKVLMRLQINGRREVEIKNKGIYEAEVSESVLRDFKRRKECDRIMEEKTNKISRALKVALERICEMKKRGM
ncbi:MAG: hypothetical protein U9N41_05880 [Euryarchaeota archaeon]|nr:hypothetical protein [Euryarchaeota archaeon]